MSVGVNCNVTFVGAVAAVIVVFSCCRRWRNNLNEPLDPFPFGVAAEQNGGQG